MATSTTPLPKLRVARAHPRPRLPTRRGPQSAAWALRRRHLYPRGGMVDVAVNELGAVITLVWPPD